MYKFIAVDFPAENTHLIYYLRFMAKNPSGFYATNYTCNVVCNYQNQSEVREKNKNTTRSFEYIFTKKRTTKVEFEVESVHGKIKPKNIKLISNWRAHYPINPKIELNSNGEYGFYENGIFITNGDIQQIIKQINSILKEY